MEKRLIGRKLYIKWMPNMYIAIEKIPDGAKKLAEIDLVSKEGLELCNVYENENGEKIEESLGAPAKDLNGFDIEHFFTNSNFWKTPGELKDEH